MQSNFRQSLFQLPKLYRSSIKIAFVISLVMIAFMYFFPLVIFQFELRSCSPEAIQQGFCQNHNAWMITLDLIVGTLSIFGSPFGLGGVLAAYHRRLKITIRQILLSLGTGMLVFFSIPVLFELVWYEPWKTQYLPDGTAYNAYQLDALFNPIIIIPMILAVLISYLATTGIMALWARLPRKQSPSAHQQ